ncbi:MAG: DeoR family transcriptional regulator [Candidatus Dojkabacteria bacterium]|nr:DeoR family transcriptional regulator [Candidatus Dojkabacteria bacterium]
MKKLFVKIIKVLFTFVSSISFLIILLIFLKKLLVHLKTTSLADRKNILFEQHNGFFEVIDKYLKNLKSIFSSDQLNNLYKKLQNSIFEIVKRNLQVEETIENNKLEQKSSTNNSIDHNLFQSVNLKPSSDQVNYGKQQKLNVRQKKILNIIKTLDYISVSDLSKKIRNVSTRTLRRDMDRLEKLGILKQNGKTKDTIYIINKMKLQNYQSNIV